MTALATKLYQDDDFDEYRTAAASRTKYSDVVNYSWQIEVQKRLQQLENLPKDWNSYGSIPPTSLVLHITRMLLTSIGDREMPAPDLSPVHGGGIQIEWHKANREFELEVFPDGHLEFLKIENNEILEEGVASSSKFNSLISWLLHE